MIFFNMIALLLRFSRLETELAKANRISIEMRESNRVLNSMNRVKTELMENLSHEMRTPLTVMSSYAGLTSLEIRHGAVSDKTLSNLEIIKSEAARLAALVERLKEVTMEKERRLEITDVKASALLWRAEEFFGPICRKNGNEIRIGEKSGDITLCVIPEGVFQALVNLMVNANRHTRNGVICLNVERQAGTGFAEVSVSDDGDGIAPELLAHIFQRGISGDRSTGLGLSICKEIVEEQGGKIRIESEKGKGTVVRLTLPCREEEKNGERNPAHCGG